MRELELRGIRRGKKARTTVPDRSAPCPRDKVNRNFRADAPNRLWVSEFTYVSTWGGFVYVAFVINVFARRIVGWRVSRTPHAAFILDALEQVFHARRPCADSGLVHHSDRDSQYVSIRYTERRVDAGLAPPSAALEAPMITHWPKPSSICSRQKSSIGAGPGGRSMP